MLIIITIETLEIMLFIPKFLPRNIKPIKNINISRENTIILIGTIGINCLITTDKRDTPPPANFAGA
ncbi:hypothetical protein AN641_08045 [Candidatus Epulonipiscioides gigas]|nr:hypothetical protein AN641_08045 [Epulopiscium sp. SCG-C07WGA-EpuloA2]